MEYISTIEPFISLVVMAILLIMTITVYALQKTLIKNMKEYLGIFDVDQFKKYNAMTLENFVLSAATKESRKALDKIIEEVGGTSKNYRELLKFGVGTVLVVFPDRREEFIKKNFVHNQKAIRAVLAKFERIKKDPLSSMKGNGD